jgi:hypothetical protein
MLDDTTAARHSYRINLKPAAVSETSIPIRRQLLAGLPLDDCEEML